MPGAIARFRSGTSAFTARDADHYTTIAIVVGQGGWIRSSGLRLPTPALFQLSYTLHVEALQPSHATPDRCFADWPRLRNRNAPSVAFSSREENRCAPGCCAAAPAPSGTRELGAARRSSLASSAKWIRTTIKRINSALPCRVGHRGIVVAPPLLRSRPRGARDGLGAARRSSLDLKLVDPLGLEPRPDGLRDRCAAVTPRVNVGKGGGNCIPIIDFGDQTLSRARA